MEIIKKTSTTNTTASKGRKILYIVEHYTAGTTSKKGSARNVASWFSQARAQASADFIVDDAEIVQYNPDPLNRYCWSVGGSHYGNKGGKLYGKAKNSNSISIEICSSNRKGKVTNTNDSNWYYTDAVLDRAVELTQHLMKKFGIDADHVIRHYDVNGKPCPGIIGWNAETGDESKWKAFKKRIGGEFTSTVVEGLTKGDSGDAVKTMQTMLIACGYDCGSTGADGDFGNNTLSGLKAFQKSAGLTVDGVYGEKTKAALEKAYKEKQSSSGATTNTGGTETGGLQASTLKNLSDTDVIKKVGPLFTADQKKSGILASVSLAQFILESGYGKSELAANANNCFGMKKILSGNTWSGSAWDGKSSYTKKTSEQNADGSYITITADFRKYACVEDSIADHSAYLNGAKNGSNLRYAGLKGCTDYKKAAQIIKNGGYATSHTYVEKLCSIIEKWNLTQYDVKGTTSNTADKTTDKTAENKTAESKPKFPYLVRVSISNLNIREKPTVNSKSHGFTGRGVFTIVDEDNGWGLLKSYQKKRNGWIKLSYAEKL